MPRSEEESSDDDKREDDPDYVVFGTAVNTDDTADPNTGSLYKKPAFMEQRVLNERGRALRFHGAFTGGFSAGYFNTVGSKEGFAPSAFKSMRSDKASLKRSLPEDYMDEEDFSEHGIAPRRVKASFQFDDTEARRRAQQSFLNSLIPDESNFLRDILVPSNLTVGMKLLRKLGWREAQLARRGPRTVDDLDTEQEDEPPVRAFIGKVSPEQCQNISNTTAIVFTPKTNSMGLGYCGIDPKKTAVFSKLSATSAGSKKVGFNPDGRPLRLGIRGQGFGVGALEKDDADIYAVEDMSNYDWDVDVGREHQDEDHEEKFGWTAPSSRHRQGDKVPEVTPPAGYVGKLLSGFTVKPHEVAFEKTYPPPSLPHNYRPRYGAFLPPVSFGINETTKPQRSTDADHEKPASVFDLMSSSDRGRLLALKCSQNSDSAAVPLAPAPKASTTNFVPPKAISGTGVILSDSRYQAFHEAPAKPPSSSAPRRWDNLSGKTASAPAEPAAVPELQQSISGNSAKRTRYEEFVKLKRSAGDISRVYHNSHLTEFERAHELEEFEAAFNQHSGSSSVSTGATPTIPETSTRPMLSSQLAQKLASRFTKGGVQGSGSEEVPVMDAPVTMQTVPEMRGGIISKEEFLRREKLMEPVSAPREKSQQECAAEMGMFGTVTRTVENWHPGRILCRRFNVQDPYPDSQVIGLPKAKRDKFSVFDFLEDAAPAAPVELVATRSHLLDKAQSSAGGLSVQEKRKNLFSVLYQESPPSKGVSTPAAPSSSAVPEPPVDETPAFVIDTTPSPPRIIHEQAEDASRTVDGEVRPPVDLFKSIFASDEDTSGDEEEENASANIPPTSATARNVWDEPIFRRDADDGAKEDDEASTYGPQLPSMPDALESTQSQPQFFSIEDYAKVMKKSKKAKHKKKDKKKGKKSKKHKHTKDES